jgi:predicted TIM-barrel fold metal-dependent hydrolase
VIDAHVHLFPDEAAGRAWQAAVGFEGGPPATVEDYGRRMVAAGIERAVVLLFPRSRHRAASLRAAAGATADEARIRAQVADEIAALNAWGCALAREDPRFVAFVGVNPRFQDADAIERAIRGGVAAGARGVKIIPPAMELYPDDSLLEPVHATCAALGVPLLSQSGAGGATPPGARGPYGRPGPWDAVLRAHPGLRLILAHLGHGHEDELVALARAHETVVTDTSLRFGRPPGRAAEDQAALVRLVREIGTERVLFGSNYPVADPVGCREALDAAPLTARERELIGGRNAEAMLGGAGPGDAVRRAAPGPDAPRAPSPG